MLIKIALTVALLSGVLSWMSGNKAHNHDLEWNKRAANAYNNAKLLFRLLGVTAALVAALAAIWSVL